MDSKQVTVSLELEKETKNTIRFTEAGVGLLDVPKIGTIYIPKQTLKEIGYANGQKVKLTLSAE